MEIGEEKLLNERETPTIINMISLEHCACNGLCRVAKATNMKKIKPMIQRQKAIIMLPREGLELILPAELDFV